MKRRIRSQKLNIDREEAYAFFYLVGVRVMRCIKATVRFTRTLWRPLYSLLKTAAVRFWRGVTDLFAADTEVRYRRIKRIFGVVAPTVAVVLLVMTLRYWWQAEFAIALNYHGTEIGYIAGEDTYLQAAAQLRDTVINADGSFTVDRAPSMTVSVLGGDTILDEQQTYDRLLQTMGDTLTNAVGVFEDGVFVGALPTRQAVDTCVKTVLSPYRTETYDEAAFFGEVTFEEGLYPLSAVCDSDTLAERLSELEVKTVKNITYTETVKYKTVYVEDESLPLGYETVTTTGKNGKQKVYAQIVYVDGKEQYRMVVSTEPIQAVRDRVVRIGAKRYSDTVTLGDGKATGKFIWPLPYTKVISSHFTNRWGRFHGAIDISNGSTNGKPILASDGGTVLEAGFHSSYGYYVLIDHGNGFMTRYAHCSKLEVKEGEKVAQGQYIAKVGNTGYSTGAHLHFEVIKVTTDRDGNTQRVLVDPLDYVER